MEHIIAALFTIGFLASHPHLQPAAPQLQRVAMHVVAQPNNARLQQRDQQILAINAWMRRLRGGHLHTPATVAERSRIPNS